MARSFTALDLVGLPNLDSPSSVALSRSLDAAAPIKDADKKPFRSTLPEHVQEGLADMAIARETLASEIDKEAAPAPTVREGDRREDNAVLATIEILGGWARLAGEIPQGDVAAELSERLFGAGSTKFINFPVKKEWAVVDGKLQVIAEEHLEESFKKLGMLPALVHLRSVHEQYGQLIGVTKAPAPMESPQVRAKRDALLEAMRTYVVRVVGMRDKKKPETNALVETLLKPLIDWEPSRAATVNTKPATPSGGPSAADSAQSPAGPKAGEG